nr:hypothetical protein CFP56_74247 [Quercus suber]
MRRKGCVSGCFAGNLDMDGVMIYLQENAVLEVEEENCRCWVWIHTFEWQKKSTIGLLPWIICVEAVGLEVQVTVEASFQSAKEQRTVQL